MSMDNLMDFDHMASLGNTSEAPFLWVDSSAGLLYVLVQAISLYLIPVICGLGLLGGMASWLVLTFSSFQHQPCSHYLAVLTAANCGFLLALLMAWLTTIQPQMASYPGYCQVMVYMTYTCSFLSAWFLVLLMVDRYITVCHPLRAPVLCTRHNARLAIVFLTVLAMLLYLHSFFTTDWSFNGHHAPCRQKEHHLHFLAIFTYLDFFVTFLLPFIAVLGLNLRTILAVRSFKRRYRPVRPDPSSARRGLRKVRGAQHCLMSQAQIRATKVLVWVATVFLVLYLPSHIFRLYLLIRVLAEGRLYSEQLMLTQQICQFFYYINFAVDFFVFSITSKSFRRNIARCLRRL